MLNEIERLKISPLFFNFLCFLWFFLSFLFPLSLLPFLLLRSLSRTFSFQAVLGYLFSFFEPLGASQRRKRPISKAVPPRSEYSSLVGWLFPVSPLSASPALREERALWAAPHRTVSTRDGARVVSSILGASPQPPKEKNLVCPSFSREAAHANLKSLHKCALRVFSRRES